MKALGWWVCIALAVTVPARAQELRHLATVHDASGGLSANTVNLGGVDYRHVSAFGQPGGVQVSTNASQINYAGFLQAADIKKPSLDTDGDGVIDELDTDNDADGLQDLDEVQGISFDPVTATRVNDADTDDDGVVDGDESVAGTDPTDASAFLRITDVIRTGSEVAVFWTARGGKDYRVLSAEESHTYPTNAEGSVTAAGGVAPWFETICGYTNAADRGVKTYGVEVRP